MAVCGCMHTPNFKLSVTMLPCIRIYNVCIHTVYVCIFMHILHNPPHTCLTHTHHTPHIDHTPHTHTSHSHHPTHTTHTYKLYSNTSHAHTLRFSHSHIRMQRGTKVYIPIPIHLLVFRLSTFLSLDHGSVMLLCIVMCVPG